MGELKSTLDLVMEKTKHLTFTEKEKNAQRLDKFASGITGIVAKFCNSSISETEAERKFYDLRTEFPLAASNA